MGSYQIDLYRGEGKQLQYSFVDASTTAAINVLSDTFKFSVKRNPLSDEDSDALITLTTGAMAITTSTVAFFLTPSMTNLPPYNYTYCLRWDSSITSTVVVEDVFKVLNATARTV